MVSLLTKNFTIWVRFPTGRNYSLFSRVHTGSGVHPVSCLVNYLGKVTGAWSWPFRSSEWWRQEYL